MRNHQPQPHPSCPTDWLWALALFTCLSAVYLLTYQGHLRSGDESFLATGAQSLARLSYFHWGAVFMERGFSPGVELGQPVVASVLDIIAGWLGLGSMHALFLLNGWVTALTAVLVFKIVRLHGYSLSTAVLSAGIYGVGTMAWPHTQYYFRDPLAVVWAMLAVWSYELTFTRRARWAQLLQWLITFTLLGISLLTKQTAALVAPALLLMAAVRGWRNPGERPAAWMGLGLVALVGVIALVLPPQGPLGAFSAWRYFGLLAGVFSRPLTDFFGEAIVGMLISPGKGLFIESPALILAVFSLWLNPPAHRYRLILPWLYLLTIVVAAPLYREGLWFGGVGWGVRHTLPAVPLLTVASAPMLAHLLQHAPRWQKVLGALLISLSLLIQVGATAGQLNYYSGYIDSTGVPGAAWTIAIWDPRYSEIVGYWRSVLTGQQLAYLWARLWDVRAPWLIVAWLATAASTAVLAGSALFLRGLQRGWLVLSLAVFALTVLPYSLLRLARADPDYVPWREDFSTANEVITARMQASDVVLVRGQGQPAWLYTFNFTRWPVPWYALPADEALTEDTVTLFANLPQQFKRAWLVNDQNSPNGNRRTEEQWLTERYTPVSAQGNVTRVAFFSLERASNFGPTNARFGEALTLVEAAFPAHTAPNFVFPITLRWQATAAAPANLNVSVYLLNEAGALVVQRDSAPVGGFRPFETFASGETVTDAHGLLLPTDLPAGRYILEVAVYNWQTLERLEVNQSGVTAATLGIVEVGR